MKTSEQRYSEMVDQLERFDDAEHAGKLLSRDTIAAFVARLIDGISAIRIAEAADCSQLWFG